MISPIRNAVISLGWWLSIALIGGIVLAAWGLSRSEHALHGVAERSFTMDIEFDKFRQILVRTDATAAILEHGGMKLIDEKTDGVDIDLSNDSHPLRNALKGKSKANVFAIKRLTVQLNDPQVNATELSLSQDCQIHPDSLQILTTSDKPAGELKAYNTTLDSVRASHRTEVKLSMDMTVDAFISRIFVSQAEARVKKAAEKSLEEPESAIRSLVSSFDGKTIILPKVKL